MVDCPGCGEPCYPKRVSDSVIRYDCRDCDLYPSFLSLVWRDIRARTRGHLNRGHNILTRIANIRVGVALMVAVTVCLAVVLATFALGLGDHGEQDTQATQPFQEWEFEETRIIEEDIDIEALQR